MAVLLVVGGISGYLVHLEITNRVLASEKQETGRQRDRVMYHLREAQAVLNRVLEHVEELSARPGLEESHRKMAEDVVRHLDALMLDSLTDDPESAERWIELQLLATRARMRLAKTYLWTGERAAARRQIDVADRAIAAVLSQAPGHRKARNLAGTNAIARAVILSGDGPGTAAEGVYKEAETIFAELAETSTSASDRNEFELGVVEYELVW